MSKVKEKKFNFTLGADPEFSVVMRSERVAADSLFKSALVNKLQTSGDGFSVKEGDEVVCKVGWDGHSATAELRPCPSNDPYKLASNIGAAWKALKEHIGLFDLSILNFWGCVGGHVHFEVPKGTASPTTFAQKVHKQMSLFAFPLIMGENKMNQSIRYRSSGYGRIRDYRVEHKFDYPDGTTGYTYELRPLSAEWISTEKIARSTLAYLGVVYHEIIYNPKSLTKISSMFAKNDDTADALQTLINSEHKYVSEAIKKAVSEAIQTFEMYETFKEEIDYILNTEQVLKDKQKVNFDIYKGWNMDNTRTPNLKQLMVVGENQDLDITNRIFDLAPIAFNEDTNVGAFAEALSTRIFAFQWKLKHDYFLFGVKKDFPDYIVYSTAGVKRNPKDLDMFTGSKFITTKSDLAAAIEMRDKMLNKMSDMRPATINIQRLTKSGFETGYNERVLIGIPYKDRINNNIKPFLRMVWEIEKGNLKPQTLKVDGLTDDEALPPEQKGTFYQASIRKAKDAPVQIRLASNRNESTVLDQIIRETAESTRTPPPLAVRPSEEGFSN